MKAESIVYAVAGIFFGLVVGWVIGSQQARPIPPVPATAASAQTQAAGAAPAPRPLDSTEVQRLTEAAIAAPKDPAPRISLGNLYFDAERFDEAIRWYEEAAQLAPRNVNVSTDLGVSYYYTNQPDRALAQFEHSLSIDPRHTKTMLNQGIVKAFAKQDLAGAVRSWERVVELAPESPEGQAARRALESVKTAHPDVSSSPGSD